MPFSRKASKNIFPGLIRDQGEHLLSDEYGNDIIC